MKFFNMDSPLMQALNKVADLLWLNLLTILCCIPIVTIGASLTALHYMALKIVRDEEVYITRGFFKSFKTNLRQGTIIWLLQLVVFFLIGGDIYIVGFTDNKFPVPFQVFIFVMAILVLLSTTYLYPLLAKFDNTVFRTIKNSIILGIAQFPKAILMIILNIVPIVIMIMAPGLFPFVFMFGLSVPAYLSATLYNKYFLKLEDSISKGDPEKTEEIPDEDRIFHDELDTTLAGREDME